MNYTYTSPMPPHRFIERYLITLAIARMRASGWALMRLTGIDVEVEFAAGVSESAVWDYYEPNDCRMRLVFEKRGYSAWIELIPGNGVDVITDYQGQIETIMRGVYLR